MAIASDNRHRSFDSDVDIGALMDDAPFSLRQMVIIFLCGLLMLMDGWDSMEIAYVAPSIRSQWHLAPSMLSFIFTASSLSSVAGPFIFGPLADRKGRRWITIIGTAVMGFASLMGAYSHSANEFLGWRLLTGCGLSAVMPNAMALGAEYAPARLRMFAVTVLYTGFPIGAAVSAGLAASLIPAYGWPSVLIVGGAMPLVLAAILLVTLPESIRFLALWRPHGPQLRQQLAKINPHWRFAPGIAFVSTEKPVTGAPIGELFRDGRAPVTILIWVIFFMNILELIFLTSWSPTLLGRAGIPSDAALYSSMLMQIGAVVGALIVARAMDRFGSYPMLFPAHVLGFVAVGVFGYVISSGSLMFVVAILMGAGVMGTQTAMNGFTANVYPTGIRSTGIGAASGIGRFGAIAGPLMGGAMLHFDLPAEQIYMVASIPPLISTLAILTIWWYSRAHRPAGAV